MSHVTLCVIMEYFTNQYLLYSINIIIIVILKQKFEIELSVVSQLEFIRKYFFIFNKLNKQISEEIETHG